MFHLFLEMHINSINSPKKAEFHGGGQEGGGHQIFRFSQDNRKLKGGLQRPNPKCEHGPRLIMKH